MLILLAEYRNNQRSLMYRTLATVLLAILFLEVAYCGFVSSSFRQSITSPKYRVDSSSTCPLHKINVWSSSSFCRGYLSLRAQSKDTGDEGEKLRREYEALLSGSGRDMGMRTLKPKKGTLAALQKTGPVEKQKTKDAERGTDTEPALSPKPPSGGGGGGGGGGPQLRPPPKPEATYQTFDELLSSKPQRPVVDRPTATPSPAAAKGPAPAPIRPSYIAAGENDVALAGFAAGDTAPAWPPLVDHLGRPVRLGDFSRDVLLVPEPVCSLSLLACLPPACLSACPSTCLPLPMFLFPPTLLPPSLTSSISPRRVRRRGRQAGRQSVRPSGAAGVWRLGRVQG